MDDQELSGDDQGYFRLYCRNAQAGADGAPDRKAKELIALAIGITQRCDGCIGFHAKALRDLGASRQEIAEMAAMGMYMGGGPALMHAADALRAWGQWSPPAES